MPLAVWAALCVLAGTTVASVGCVLLAPTVRFALAATASAEGLVVGHDQEDTAETICRSAWGCELHPLRRRKSILGWQQPKATCADLISCTRVL